MDIDFVIPWVDGSDPAWLEEKRKYESAEDLIFGSKNRYRDWDLLRYLFRGIETFAPWVRQVFFVTWGHIPAFLNTAAPKLKIVKHTDFIPSAYLPTFNSRSIELNIHRIPGLSEHFVYFNDDVFLLQPSLPEHFFRNGLPCSYGAEALWASSRIPAVNMHDFDNCMGIINMHFNKQQQIRLFRSKYISPRYPWKQNIRTLMLELLYSYAFITFPLHHGPAAFLKNSFREVWDAEEQFIDASCKEKFRSSNQVSQYLVQWWQIASGTFSPSLIDNAYFPISDKDMDTITRIITRQEHRYICLNDPDRETIEDITALSTTLQTAFETILPQKSAFEL